LTKKPESRLQQKIRRSLEKDFGGFWVKIWGGPFQQAGIPDLIGCCEGHFFAFEVKTPKGKPSALQLDIIDKIKKAGGVAAVITTYEEARVHVLNRLNAGPVSRRSR